MKEITRILPPGEEKEINYDKLRELAYRAAIQSLELLSPTTLPFSQKSITVVDTDSPSEAYIDIPQYRSEEMWDFVAKIWDNEKVIEMTNYLWERGALKKTLSGPDPDKKSWARFIFSDLIQQPLLQALEDFRIEALIRRAEDIPTWHIEPDALREAINNKITQLEEASQGIYYCRATCPMPSIELADDLELDLEDGFKVRKWSHHERSIHLTFNQREYYWNDVRTTFLVLVDHFAEIEISLKLHSQADKKAALSEAVAEKLDILRWSLMISSGKDSPITEGVCLITDRAGQKIGRFDRDARTSWSRHKLTFEKAKTVIQVYQSFRSKADRNPDLYRALWHLGRSTFATLERDALLESAIGLDAVLVSGGGDSRYRFCLHGTAALSVVRDDDVLVIYDLLKKIYSKRSSAAHGEPTKDINVLVKEARKVLADVVHGILKLAEAGHIDAEGGVIANEVQKYVINKVYFRQAVSGDAA